MDKQSGQQQLGVFIGLILMLLGVIFFLGQVTGDFFRIDFGRWLWPFFVIVPGLLLVGVALAVEGQATEAVVILGSMVTMIGLLLFFQNVTELWASWSYAWALVVPTGPGLGLILYGSLRNRPERIQAGRRLAGIGVIIFLIGAIFFELIIGVSGFGLGRFAWPLLLIGLGLAWLAGTLFPRTRSQ